MREGIFYRGSANLGQPSLEEPDGDYETPDAELESLAATPEGLGLDCAEVPYVDPITEAIEAMHQDERARAMRRMVMA